MDLLTNPLIETILATVFNPVVLAVTVLVSVALSSGFVARSMEVCNERLPVRIAAGTRSPARGRSGPGA